MIPRLLASKLKSASRKFPVVAVTGPRQSGKTTLVRSVFPSRPYVSLEDLDTREFAQTDPRGFLRKYEKGAILDEIQRAPQLFSYLQGVVDKGGGVGRFILTGSHHFLLLENLSQTLAGRVLLLKLLPFGLEEIQATPMAVRTPEEAVFKGFYPALHDRKIHPRDWYSAYIQTYLERDVRLIKNIDNLSLFQRFLKMCASRTAQLLNLSSLANDCGITHNTARSWIGILEASFIVYLLPPYHQSFNKRLVKSPKLYFYDPGLACSLLGIEHLRQVGTHPLRGNLFETLVMGELHKRRFHRGLPSCFFFWRDKTGHEVDCLVERGSRLIPVEIKSSETVTHDSFRDLDYWRKLRRQKGGPSFLVYAGNEVERRKQGTLLGWESLEALNRLLV